jgi:sporulation protein YlmC with PRC-barrel domain
MMLKQLLAATAMITIATAAHAASTNTDANAATTVLPATGKVLLPAANAGDHLASKLMGAAVYENDSADAQSIGNVNDIVIADNGAVSAVVVGVGGFLGIGQKNVALDFTSLHWANRDGGPVLVASATKDDLNNAPAFDTAAIEPAANTAPVDQTAQNAPAAGTTGTMSTDQGAAVDNKNQMAAQAPAANGTMGTNGTTATDQSQMTAQNNTTGVAAPNAADMQTVDVAQISAKDLMNATVYSATNENVGEVGDVILAQDGKIDAVVLDVGGFLGLGEKPVAIGFDGLDVRKDANGALFVYTKFSKDQLEAAPQYDKNAYAGSRDTMRLVAPM